MSGALDGPPPQYGPTWLYRVMLRAVIPTIVWGWGDVHVEGREHIPTSGPFIIVSNHVDNNDSYVIGRFIHRTIHFLARPGGMDARVLGRFWRMMAAIPADREGLALALAMLKAGEVVGIYPDGVITPRLVQAKAGVAALAVRAGVPVLPVALWGTEAVQLWPLHGRRRQRVELRYGPPRTLDRAAVRGRGLQKLADEIMTDVALLLPPGYRGYYAAAAEARIAAASDTAAGANGATATPVDGAGAALEDSQARL